MDAICVDSLHILWLLRGVLCARQDKSSLWRNGYNGFVMRLVESILRGIWVDNIVSAETILRVLWNELTSRELLRANQEI